MNNLFYISNNKIFSYNNMGRISNNQKIRNSVLQELISVKDKLNIRTYNAYKTKITDKRIDAVKRIGAELKILGLVNLQTKSLKGVKQVVSDVPKTLTKIQSSFRTSTQKFTLAKKQINNFNRTGNDTTIKNLTPNKLKVVLNNLKLQGSKRIVMNIGGRHFTLTTERLKYLIGVVDKFWVDESIMFGGSDGDIAYDLIDTTEVKFTTPKWFGGDTNTGSFFKYYHNTDLNLEEFGIYTQETTYEENCFVQSLISAGVDDLIIKGIRSMVSNGDGKGNGKYIPTRKFTEVGNKFNLYFRIKKNLKDRSQLYGDKNGTVINIGLIDKHYFNIKTVPITSYALEHYEELKHIKDYHKIIKKNLDKSNDKYKNSFDVINHMFDNKDRYLKEIPFEDLIKTQYFTPSTEINDLTYHDTNVKQFLIKDDYIEDDDEFEAVNGYRRKKKQLPIINVFCDFEALTDEDVHKPYMVCSSERDFIGYDCAKQLLYYLWKEYRTTHRVKLIAHNAGYDFKFLQKHLTMTKIIERGNFLLQATGLFHGKAGQPLELIIQDSYSLIPMALKKFKDCFDIEMGKDILPYNLYTRININKRYMKLLDIIPYLNKQVRCNNLDREPTDDDYYNYKKDFITNCVKWNCMTDEVIDIIEYSYQYCKIDVKVLEQGYDKFNVMLNVLNMNLDDYMSSAQLANNYMEKNDVFDGCYKLSGTPREFIMKCMVGGRTMCKENQKQLVDAILDDFDAVSLYPSAMERLGGYLKGVPNVLKDNQLDYEFLKKQDGYFVKIIITKVNKPRKFALSSYKNEKGVRVFSNELKNYVHVGKIGLEDLIKFQDIEYEIVSGYYYNQGRNPKLKKVIRHLFQQRLDMKEEENPIEFIYKLIMNSAYGKTLLKPYEEDITFKDSDTIDKYVDKNYNMMKYYQELECEEGKTIKHYKCVMEKSINDHFNFVHLGVEVLEMSKRIMNEVMCLAEDNDMDIYYQDTDSIHIKSCDIQKLSALYFKEYGRNLIGEDMGQFHTDFSSKIITGNTYKNKDTGEVITKNMTKDEVKVWLNDNKRWKKDPIIHSKMSIFLGKKCYIDWLFGVDTLGKYVEDYHIRMKGVPNDSIKYKAKEEERNLMDIYQKLHDGKKEEFDLCCGGDKIRFKSNKNYTISTREKFSRELNKNNIF